MDLPENKNDLDFIYSRGNIQIDQGRLLKSGDTGKVLLGNNFLNTDSFGKKLGVGKKIKINGKEFEIVGFLKKSSSFELNGVALMMHDDLSNLLDIKGEYDLFEVQVENQNQIGDVSNAISNALRRDRNEKIGEETFTVQTPLQSLSAVNNILNIINLIVIGIAAISLLVGAVGIANTMYTSVLERTKEIGVMKAIGAKNSDIRWIFLIESGLLGLVGGVVGALTGIGAAIGVSSIANQFLGSNLFIVTVSYTLLIEAFAFSFFIGIISGTLPAIQASRLNVVDALRK